MFFSIGQSLVMGAFNLATACLAVYYVFLLPPKHPKIPAIPFWVALIPFFRDVDQSDIFKKYIDKPLRTHGAVKIFFGAQWNVLVHRPSYLAQIFKEEDLYQKSGNHQKIPHSVLAAFLGENVISAHGSIWKDYRLVIQPGLQRTFEVDIIVKNARSLCELLQVTQDRAPKGGGLAVQDLLQRYSVANCSEVLLQTKLHALDSESAHINVLQTAVKREIFKPIFMNFPFLDRLPFPSRMRARQMVHQFKNELKHALVASHTYRSSTRNEKEKVLLSGVSSAVDQDQDQDQDKLGSRLLGAKATRGWSEKQLLDNLTVTFVAGQENPQLCMISTLYLLAKHPKAQARIYQELLDAPRRSPSPGSGRGATAADGCSEIEHDEDDWLLSDCTNLDVILPYMTSVIYESLRLFPPIGQLINRRVTGSDALLLSDNGTAEILIPRGTYVGYNCYSTNRDPEAWGKDAETFDPGRWGTTLEEIRKESRRRRLRAHFISFHGGRRACLGERFAMLEMRATLAVLVRRFHWSLDPGWCERMTPAGPLYPRALRLVFTRRECAVRGGKSKIQQ